MPDPLFLIKLIWHYVKKTLTQVFFCEFYEISKNTFSYRIPLVGASEKEMICEILIFKYHFLDVIRYGNVFKPPKIFLYFLQS